MMEVEISQEKNNELFNRREISGVIKSKVIPKREEVLEFLSKKYSKPVELIKVKGIQGGFGSQEFKMEANIYDSKEEKDAVEIKKKKEEEMEKRKIETEKAQVEAKKAAEEAKKTENESKEKQGESDQPEQEKSEEVLESEDIKETSEESKE
jgi:ribosomal protein S24E